MDKELIELIKEYHKCMHKWNFTLEYYSKSEGISYTTFKVLGVIFMNENCTQKDIYEAISIPKQTINAAITYLYKKGYIKLVEPPEDRRVKIIHLTEKGKKYAEGIFSNTINCELKAIKEIGEEKMKTLTETMNSYVDLLLKSIKELY